jgi:hypothetical protein
MKCRKQKKGKRKKKRNKARQEDVSIFGSEIGSES